MSLFFRKCSFVLLTVLAGAGPASAQQFTIVPLGSQALEPSAGPVRVGPDFATNVLHDPWDFEEASDYVYMFSEDPADPMSSAWAPVPVVADGRFRGNSRVSKPRLQMLFEGITGGLNVVGRNGVRYPIDATKYTRLSFRMKRSVNPVDALGAAWFTQTNRNLGTTGFLVVASQGYDDIAGRYHNQSQPGSQSAANAWHIYKIDLDASHLHTYDARWAGSILGMRIDVGDSAALQGAAIDLDWVRLTERGTAIAQLNFAGFGGPVTVTARHLETNDVIQVFPDTGGNVTTFADNSSFVWDYGFLPPGTWQLIATGNGKSESTTFQFDAAPYIEILDPDEKGGRDYGRTVVGDAYDLTNVEDVSRDGRTHEVINLAYGENGLTAGVTEKPDPFIYLLDDSTKAPGTGRAIDASVYRHLTFTLEFDRKDLTFLPALLGDFGGVARVVWRANNKNGSPLTTTQDIFVLDGGPHTYSMDLPSFTTPGDCPTCTIEPGPPYDFWQGLMSVLRFDPYETDTPRSFRLADIRIAADDEPNGNGFFPIRWQIRDATFSREVLSPSPGSDATVQLFYDTDTNASNGRVLIATVPAASGVYNWNVAGLAAGRYFVHATVTDTAGNSQSRYSGGPVGIASVYPPPTDTSGTGMPDAWRARYEVSNPSADEDGDGLSNLAEYQQATNPLVSNTWMLPEGATGFFIERIALANPDPSPANVTLIFLRKVPAGQPPSPPIVRDYTVIGNGRLTVTANQVAGLSSEEFSTVVTSTTGGVLAERTMFWGDQRYGGHTGKAVQSARTNWYLAEGNAGFFQTWILLANATGQNADVQITYLLPGGGTVVQHYPVDANSRFTVFANDVAELAGKSFSADISSNVPITVERAMYFGTNPFWVGGHAAAAVEAPATDWFVAEGRTGPFFDTFLLLANPNPTEATVTVRYLLPDGASREAPYTLEPYSRKDLWLDVVLEETYGIADTDVSASISSNIPIVVERAMYWPGDPPTWNEAHASAGVTQTGTLWALAEGEFGTNLGYDTYILFANPGNIDATVRLTILRPTGVPSYVTLTVRANSRETWNADQIGVQPNEQFGLLIESINDVPIVVERAMYWNGGGQHWGGGSNETAFRLR